MGNYTYNDLKNFINKSDFDNAIKAIIELYIFDQEDFVNHLLLNGCIPEPLSRNFSDKKMEFVDRCCGFILKVLSEGDDELAKGFKHDISKLFITIKNLRTSDKSNQSRLFKNDFLKNPFTKQVQMLGTFIESQSYYANDKVKKRISTKGYTSGLEHEMPESEYEVSVSDVMEANLEILDTILRLLHFTARGKIDGQDVNCHKDVSPYNIPSIEEIMHLALHRRYLEEFWAKYKYEKWDFSLHKTVDDINVFYYKPPNSEDYMKERAAIIRYKYRDFINHSKKMDYKSLSDSINYIERKSNFSLEDPAEVFSLEDEIFVRAQDIVRISIEVSWSQLEEDVGSLIHNALIGEQKDIKIEEVFYGIEYLSSLAYVYRGNSHKNFDDTDFSYLTPVFKTEQLISHFARLYELDENKAETIIEIFIFRPQPLLDIFSQPLIYAGDNRVVFTPHLVIQMNITRIINQHLTKWGVDISKKGYEMEEQLKILLNFSKHFHVNGTDVKFEAYDGRNVEYDLIATFNKKIFLIELKCLTAPFSSKEFMKRESDILYGVEQVNRREDILVKEWEKIQDMMDISLPIKPPKKEDIVKVVCTNIFDFTGRVEGDVHITDISSFMKFFLNPEVQKVQVGLDSTKILSEDKLWDKQPTLKKLEEYLKSPIAIKWILDKLKEVPRQIQLINEGDPALAFEDYTLEGNPFEAESPLKSKDGNVKKKIGRNEPCPCGSEKKYKKCHGQN